MISELIQQIELSILFYVKQVEGLNYSGDHTFTMEYINNSEYLTRSRKKNIGDIIILCQNAILRQNSAKELTRDIVDYVQNCKSYFERLFNLMPRLQKDVIQAISQYYPALILLQGSKAIVNSDALSYRPIEGNGLPSLEENARQQLLNQHELILQLQATNIALQKQLDKQQNLFDKFSYELEQAKLEIIVLRKGRATPSNLRSETDDETSDDLSITPPASERFGRR